MGNNILKAGLGIKQIFFTAIIARFSITELIIITSLHEIRVLMALYGCEADVLGYAR